MTHPLTSTGRARAFLRSVALLALMALVAAGCGTDDDQAAAASSKTISVKHAQGTTDVPVTPKQVIVFDMAVLDTIKELGASDSVIGLPKSNIPEFLSDFDTDEHVNAGTLFEPDFEEIAEADPDLIIVGGRSSDAYAELAKIAPTIDLTLAQGDVMAAFRDNVETLAEIFDAEDTAADKLETIEESIERVRAQAGNAGPALLVMSSGGKLTAYGPGSRFGILHDVLGVKAALPDLEPSPHGEAASFELVLEADPEWLFVLDRDSAIGEEGAKTAEQVLDNELIAKTTAWKQEQVVYLDSMRWYIVGSGLGTVAAMVDEVGTALGS